MFVDSHCHLDFPELASDLEQVLSTMKALRVDRALCISVSLETFPRVRTLAERFEHLYATVGVHPDHRGEEPDAARLVALADHPKVVAIGETGLDYYRLEGDLEWQRSRFRAHIRAAREIGKPLVIHTRNAAEDTLRIMEEEGASRVGGVMHCFTETWEVAKAALDLGFLISFSGIVTFKNAAQVREVARRVPIEKMLIETDSPYLAPVPHRGKTNQPGYVAYVAEEIARLREIPVEAVAEATTRNFLRLFRLSAD